MSGLLKGAKTGSANDPSDSEIDAFLKVHAPTLKHEFHQCCGRMPSRVDMWHDCVRRAPPSPWLPPFIIQASSSRPFVLQGEAILGKRLSVVAEYVLKVLGLDYVAGFAAFRSMVWLLRAAPGTCSCMHT
jgi:hypothetical protein